MSLSERRAWETLSQLAPEQVCARAKVTFDGPSGTYVVRSFNQDISVCVKDGKLSAYTAAGELLLNELGHFSRLSILWYLIAAKEMPLSGELVRPSDIPGGQIYLKGSHVLPLHRIAGRYDRDIPGFFSRGRQLGGTELSYGDASLRLWPFPRVPVSLILWKGDAEFPSACSLLFDSTCSAHLPPDVIWATAMMSLSLMLEGSRPAPSGLS